MTSTTDEILKFMKEEENDVKFIRLVFCDLFGVQKNISIMPDELPQAFEHGISFDANAIDGFKGATKSDLLLFPDPATFAVLPWRPQQGRVARFFCNINNPDGSNFTCDTRGILKKVMDRCERKGYVCRIGAECEFYLFQTDVDGKITNTPYDEGGYFDVAPLDKGENIRREICFCLEEMGIKPERSHHEQGPGQNEIDFKLSDALTSADSILTFKTVVKSIAARNGLYASFLPKPSHEKSGSGFHVNLSLSQNGLNVFKNGESGYSSIAESFIAGVLKRVAEVTAFLNPIENSYSRLGAFEAPMYVSWSHQNRSQLIRIPSAKGDKVRIELRSPDSAVNPYLAFALIVSAGLDGMEKELTLPGPVNEDLYTADDSITASLARLPQSLKEAVALTKDSDFAKESLGEEVFHRYIEHKEMEAEDAQRAQDAEIHNSRYFKRI